MPPFGLEGADAIPKGHRWHPVQRMPASATREEAHPADLVKVAFEIPEPPIIPLDESHAAGERIE